MKFKDTFKRYVWASRGPAGCRLAQGLAWGARAGWLAADDRLGAPERQPAVVPLLALKLELCMPEEGEKGRVFTARPLSSPLRAPPLHCRASSVMADVRKDNWVRTQLKMKEFRPAFPQFAVGDAVEISYANESSETSPLPVRGTVIAKRNKGIDTKFQIINVSREGRQEGGERRTGTEGGEEI